MNNINKSLSINETYIIDSADGNDIFSACTALYSNNIISCSGNTTINLGENLIVFNGNTLATIISATTYYGDGSNLTGVSTQDTFVTGGTYSNGTAVFRNNTGGTFTVSGFYTGSTTPFDVFVTGGTYNNGTALFTNNTGGTFSVSGFNTTTPFTGGTVSGSTIFTNGLSATTISATTYLGLPIPTLQQIQDNNHDLNNGVFNAGTGAGDNNTGIVNQNALGFNAGKNNNGSNQNALGGLAGFQNQADNQNAFGYAAGVNNFGDKQNAFGESAGVDNQGDYQNALGFYAGRNNTGINQNALGFYAGTDNTGINQNALGFSAGQNNNGSNQNAFGESAGLDNQGDYQNAFGQYAGQNNSGQNQNAIGEGAGANNQADSQNALGSGAGQNNQAGNQNALGSSAGTDNTGQNQNALGPGAGSVNTGDNQNALGIKAGQNNSGQNQNAIGEGAGIGNSGNDVNAFGRESGFENTFNNVNLFGTNASADEDGQTVLSKDGTIMARISTGLLTDSRAYKLPNAGGTIALLNDIPTNTSQLINDGDDGTSPFVTADQLPSNLNLFATNVSSDIATYFKLVTSIDDPDYNTTPVDIPTGAITTTGQFIAALSSEAGVLIGNPGIINLLTIGNVRRVSGSGTAEFYYEVYHRNSVGTETLISTSNKTAPVNTNVYTEFLAAALLNNGTFLVTDRIVVKYYADRIGSGSNPSYEFQFGGTSPVRTTFPVPASNLPFSLETLSDVSISGATAGQVLAYTPSTQLWENKTIPTVLGYIPSQTWSSALDGTSVANTLIITPTYVQLIPAGTFAAGDVVEIFFRWVALLAKTSITSSIIYANTTNNLSTGSPIQVAIGNSGTSTRSFQISRNLAIKGANTRVINSTVSSASDIGSLPTSNNVSINWNVDQFIIFAISHSTNDQPATFGDFYRITKN
jgi:hypothetical protein